MRIEEELDGRVGRKSGERWRVWIGLWIERLEARNEFRSEGEKGFWSASLNSFGNEAGAIKGEGAVDGRVTEIVSVGRVWV